MSTSGHFNDIAHNEARTLPERLGTIESLCSDAMVEKLSDEALRHLREALRAEINRGALLQSLMAVSRECARRKL